MRDNPFENITGRLVAAEMAVANHKPGRRITCKDGCVYIVNERGMFIRMTGKHGRDRYGRKVAK